MDDELNTLADKLHKLQAEPIPMPFKKWRELRACCSEAAAALRQAAERIRELEQSLEGWSGAVTIREQRIAVLEARCDELEHDKVSMTPYCGHKQGCNKNTRRPVGYDCTCGWDDVEKANEPERKAE